MGRIIFNNEKTINIQDFNFTDALFILRDKDNELYQLIIDWGKYEFSVLDIMFSTILNSYFEEKDHKLAALNRASLMNFYSNIQSS